MTVYECASCEGDITNPENSFTMRCPHCNRTVFGCPVDGCKQTLKGKQGVHSHFTFADPRNKHTTDKEEQFKNCYDQWKQDRESEQRNRREHEIRTAWISENKSKYYDILTEVPVGKGRVSGQPRRIDIVAVREMIELPGHLGNQPATQGEKALVETARKSDDYPTEKQLAQLCSRHQGGELEVEVYEVKRNLKPQALGQLLVYIHRLPAEYNINILEKGIIFGKEYTKDSMCAQAAKEQGIDLHQI